MIPTEKIHLLRRAARHFDNERHTIGDQRARVGRQLNERKADRSNISNPNAAGRLDAEIADLEKKRAAVEEEFIIVYNDFLAAQSISVECVRWLNKQGMPNPAEESNRPKFGQPTPVTCRQGQHIIEIEVIRTKIKALKDRRSEIQNAPLPASVLIARKTSEIDAVLDEFCDPDRTFRSTDVGLLFIAAHSEELKKFISAHIKKAVGDKGIKKEDKLAQVAEIDAAVLELERLEERLCLEVEAGGDHVARRRDFSPDVFFGVTLNGAIATGTNG